ncbi:cyclic nucleotide-gated ion channel 1-like isoform X2 [Carya illinoinensis]|uniref:cyclic nucleotide-gated ion channel 1-like isoform X2 n=1 Tax=Carya illinoinensis TaxID=32201 RepID=UPI001C72767F|nr:cyclic nucleotide-gated ion channel 1-like isoform X2 [Carya illinoinensis]
MDFSRNSYLRPLPIRRSSYIPWKINEMMDNFLYPQGEFLDRWNKLFVLSCAISWALDPLFFYIPMWKLNDQETCLDSDRTLALVVSVLRSVTDAFYAIHIYFQFRTVIVQPSSRVFGTVDLTVRIAKRYLSTYFTVDILAILPLPQVVVFVLSPSLENATPWVMIEVLKLVIFCQSMPRLLRIYPLYVEVTRSSGRLATTALGGAAYYFLLCMLSSHVVGAFWYIFGIARQGACWQIMCRKIGSCGYIDYPSCGNKLDQADFVRQVIQACRIVEPAETKNSTDDFDFDFGIFTTVLKSGVMESSDFLGKFSYCFWWGFRSLSSIGQNLETSSTYLFEIIFVFLIATYGMILFFLLIDNLQKYTQSTTIRRVEEMMVRKTDAEQWMSRRNLPYCLRERIRQYEHYKWLETRGVEEENAIHNLPKQLRREIKRHLCFDLLMKVPMFAKMDQQLWNLLFDRLKPVVYTQGSYILREGDPVDEMLFIMRGNLTTITINGGITSFNSTADFCGEELLTWALYAQPSTKFPISTKLVVTETVVDAFVLMAEDLRTLASQFPKLHIKELQQANKTWVAAGFIQSAWRRYRKRKHERALCDAENRLQYSLANEVGASESFGATMQRPEGTLNTRVRQLLPPSKPVEPNFNVEGDNTSQTSIGHSPNMVNIVRTEIRAALAEHRMSLLEDLEKIIMPIMTRLADMEGRMTATEEVARTRGL